MLTLDQLSSPGYLLSRRQSMQSVAERALLAGANQLRSAMRAQYARGGQLPLTGQLLDLWATSTSAELSNLPEDERVALASELALSTLPGDMYETARAVVLDSALHSLSSSARLEAFDRAMDLDTGNAVEAPDQLTAALWSFGMNWRARIRRDARTVGTKVIGWLTNTGLMVFGVPFKRWVTRRDGGVRETHAHIDGLTIPVNELFPVGGYSLQYPGDGSGGPEEVINCRCVLTAVLRP